MVVTRTCYIRLLHTHPTLAVNLFDERRQPRRLIMRKTTIKPRENKELRNEECCDLYGEYCYPCTAPAEPANRKGEMKVGSKQVKRRSE